jgi:hypothetical protein
MSTTLNQAAYNVLNLVRGGRSTNNEYISLEQVKFAIRYYRALLFRRDIHNGRRTEGMEQELQPVKLEPVTLSTDNHPGLFPASSGVISVLRSVEQLPETIRIKDRDGITYVGGDQAVGAFQLIDYMASPWQQYNKYTNPAAGFRRAWTREDYLYLSAWDIAPLPDVNITVRGIFEDPETAHDWRRLSQVTTVTVTGASGTLSITINGVAYIEAFDTNATTTVTNWVTTHTTALGLLSITSADAGSGVLTLTGTTALNNFSVYDTSTTMVATPVDVETLNPAYDDDTTPYPIPLDLLQQITQSLLNGEMQLLARSPNDEVLDQLPTGQ